MNQTHPKMKGSAWTWGPDEQDRYLAAGECKSCGAQVMGGWKPSREDAVADLLTRFDAHVCREDSDA